MQLSVFEMVKKGTSTIIEVVDDFARTELMRLENLINNLATVATTGSYNDLTDKPVIPTPPELSEVAYTGEYNDLLNKPTLFSGNYNDLTNKPTIPSKTSQLTNDSGFIGESIGVVAPFRKIKVGNLAITHGMTGAENYPITNSAGSLYFYDKTISIPSNVRLSTLYDVNVTPLGSVGCIGAMVISATTSSITIRVFNNASATVSLRMNITMIGE